MTLRYNTSPPSTSTPRLSKSLTRLNSILNASSTTIVTNIVNQQDLNPALPVMAPPLPSLAAIFQHYHTCINNSTLRKPKSRPYCRMLIPIHHRTSICTHLYRQGQTIVRSTIASLTIHLRLS